MEEINQIGVQQLPYHRCTATYPYVFLTLHSFESFNQETRIVMDKCNTLTAFSIPVCDYICIVTTLLHKGKELLFRELFLLLRSQLRQILDCPAAELSSPQALLPHRPWVAGRSGDIPQSGDIPHALY